MRKLTFCLAVAALLACGTASAGTPGRFMQYPDINGDTIVFSWERDLWTVPAAGGVAHAPHDAPRDGERRRSSRPTASRSPSTGQYDGGPAIYVMPADRRRAEAGDLHGRRRPDRSRWTPDGKKIVFRSAHENTFRPIMKLYTVSPDGDLPEQMPMERGILCSFSPDGTKLVYNRRGNEEYYWKRYKGGQYTDIWLYDFKANTFAPLTDYVGKNAYPMWIGNRMYFVSDRGKNGIANLFTYDFATKKVEQVTDFADFDVQMPETDGKSIVFVQAGWLYVLDTATNKVAAGRRRDAERPLAAGRPHDQPARLHPRRWRCRTTARRRSSRRAATSSSSRPTTAGRRAT